MFASRSTRAVLVAFAMALAGAAWAWDVPGTAVGQERIVALRETATGTVSAIDPVARQLTLRGRFGEASFRVDPKAGALEGIQVGSTVSLECVAGIGLTVRRGDKPGGQVEAAEPGKRITVVARVLAVDRARQAVRVQGQGSHAHVAEFHVQDKADLAGVRVGDWLVAVVYELVAVGVAPAAR